jgi:glycine cleavage system pyridoxal-binding protein P
MFVQEIKRKQMFVNSLFLELPQTLSVLQTRSAPIGVELVVGNHQEFDFSTEFFEQYFNILENTVKFMIIFILKRLKTK